MLQQSASARFHAVRFQQPMWSVEHGRGAGGVVAETQEPANSVVLLVHVVQVMPGRVCTEHDWRELRRLL